MSNTVGSQEAIPRILRARKNLILTLSQEEFDILFGTVLGDAYITKLGRIQLEQGIKQYEYLKWKYQKLKSIVSTSILSAKRKTGQRKETISYRFWTKQYFRPWREIFYPSGKKIIPRGAENLLSPLALAVWYMDDGFKRQSNAIALATDKFDEQSLFKIQKFLIDSYGIKANIVYRKRLYFGKEASIKLAAIMKPFIIPSMHYKLP